MPNYRVASRYAKSLLDLGIEQNNLDRFNDDMKLIHEALESRDLKLLVLSPIIKSDKKNRIFDKIFTGKLDKTTMGFLKILTKKGRESVLPEIVTSFLDQYKKHKKITPVKLTTASSIGNDFLESIKKTLLDSNETESVVEISSEVNEELLGGFVLEIGDKLYDASVLHKLNKIKKEFSENKYIKSY